MTDKHSDAPLSPTINIDSLSNSRRNSTESPSINDDLATADVLTPAVNRIRQRHLRNVSMSSFSSFAHTADDASIILGSNKISETTISPLQQNSIFELIHNADNHRRTSTGLLSINSGNATINLRGPTVRDIPPTTLSKIEKVKSSQFSEYLSEIEHVYEQFNNNQTLTEETLGAYMQQLAAEDKKQKKSKKIVSSSNEDNYDDDDDDDDDNDGMMNINAEEDPGSLKQIPKIYFSSDFRLDNPRVFDEVIENSSLLTDTTRDFSDAGVIKPLVDNNHIQDKLSSYLDTVEIHLIHEISKSSNSFFSAIDDLKVITNKSKLVADQLKSIDSKLELLEKNQTHGATEILQLIQKRNNVEKLEQGLLQIHTILHQADLAEVAYFDANYEDSLETIDTVFALIGGNKPPHPIITKLVSKWKYPLLDLNRLHSLSSLKKNLMILVSDTGKSYSNLFGDFLIEDLRGHYENNSTEDTLDRLSSELSKNRKLRHFARPVTKVKQNYSVLTDEFKAQTKSYLTGLARCGEVVGAFASYEDKCIAEFKNIIKTHLPTDIYETDTNNQHSTFKGSVSGRSDGSSATASGGGGLRNNVKAMTPKEFEDMLVTIYTQVSEASRRLKTQQKYLLNTAIECLTANDPHLIDNEPDLIMQLDITTVISDAIDITQSRMARIIAARKEQTVSISLSYFLRFYAINMLFINECEMVSGNILTAQLQESVNLQTRLYESEFHNTNMKLLPDRVEKEVWKEASLPLSSQTIVNEIIKSATEDVWTGVMQVRPQQDGPSATNTNDDNAEQTERRKTLVIDDKSIIVPEVVNYLLKVIKEYILFKEIFPGSSGTHITEIFFLLNLKISQSVLAAGAMKTAGLKHITSKHLAITSQFLDFVIDLIPYIQRCFERLDKSENSKVPDEFRKVLKVLTDHKEQIFSKIVTMMGEIAKKLTEEIKTINWSNVLPQQQVHRYIEQLIDQTLRIARVLQRYLPEDQHSYILTSIFESYKTTLIDSYSHVSLQDSIEKAVMMRDVDYFREKLGDVTGYGTSGQLIWEAVNNLSTAEDVRMESVMRNSIIQERSVNERKETPVDEAQREKVKEKSLPPPPPSDIVQESEIKQKEETSMLPSSDHKETVDEIKLPPTPSEIDGASEPVTSGPASSEPVASEPLQEEIQPSTLLETAGEINAQVTPVVDSLSPVSTPDIPTPITEEEVQPEIITEITKSNKDSTEETKADAGTETGNIELSQIETADKVEESTIVETIQTEEGPVVQTEEKKGIRRDS